MVSIIEENELTQFEMPGYGGGFGADTLHQVSIGAYYPGIVIYDFKSRSVIPCRQMPFGHSHADGIGAALPQRPRSGFHTGSDSEFRMPRCFTAPLAEILEVVQG
jgi:hypothetical protein